MKKIILSLVVLFGLISVPAVSNLFDATALEPADMIEKQLEVEKLSLGETDNQLQTLVEPAARRRCHRGKCYDDGRRRRPPRRRPPSHRREYVCYAESARGHWYSDWSHSPRIAQNRAMRECYTYHRRCYEAGCRRH